MDGSTECLPEDADLLGFLPLRAYYQQLDASSLREVLKGKKIPISEQMAVRAARIASCAKGLADDSRVDFFRFDENDGKFVLTDQESKVYHPLVHSFTIVGYNNPQPLCRKRKCED